MTTTIHTGDCLAVLARLPARSVHACITSPPYWRIRDYQHPGQLGQEPTPEEYIAGLVAVFRQVRRILHDDGTLWVNIGDVYRDKQLLGLPWRLAFALHDDGWLLRSECIWHKTNAMPESVKDRPTRAHETVFLLAKSPAYYYDLEATKVPCREMWGTRDRTRAKYNTPGTGLAPHGGLAKEYATANRRTVWPVATAGTREAHYAAYPPELVEPCVLAGSPVGGVILDPFLGSGTTALVAARHGRHCVGIELNGSYVDIARDRLEREGGMFADVVLAA